MAKDKISSIKLNSKGKVTLAIPTATKCVNPTEIKCWPLSANNGKNIFWNDVIISGYLRSKIRQPLQEVIGIKSIYYGLPGQTVLITAIRENGQQAASCTRVTDIYGRFETIFKNLPVDKTIRPEQGYELYKFYVYYKGSKAVKDIQLYCPSSWDDDYMVYDETTSWPDQIKKAIAAAPNLRPEK